MKQLGPRRGDFVTMADSFREQSQSRRPPALSAPPASAAAAALARIPDPDGKTREMLRTLRDTLAVLGRLHLTTDYLPKPQPETLAPVVPLGSQPRPAAVPAPTRSFDLKAA